MLPHLEKLSRFCAVLLFIVGCKLAAGQSALNGSVVDPDGVAVSGVDVQLRTPKGAIIRHSVSDAQGNFHWQPVSPDQYVLEVAAKYGFEAYSAPIHLIRLSEPFLKIQLALPSVQAQVTVESAQSSVTTDPTENRDQIAVSSQMLEKVPVFDQNYIAALTPFLDPSGVGTNGVTIIVDGVEMKGKIGRAHV